MPTSEALVAFALTSFVLIVIPGPSVLFVIGRALSYGRRGALMSVLGNELGALVLAAAVAFGVGSIVAGSIMLFTAIKLLGAVYLLFLGVQAIRHRKEGGAGDVESDRRVVRPAAMLRQGFAVGVTNPKTIVFFVAVLPQFVSFEAGSIPFQMLVLSLLFITIAFVFDAAWALLAGTARAWFARSPRRMSAMRASGGVMMVGLAGGLALTGNKG
ncbi:LysE family translocator [Umezawaea tangerina]|uniref:Threonine/homoserine/homoserine lactone efflux protein n=1 Tax=Umezawaea tangerina TaxID=84725 RepID=A0A2T0T1C6_9PSEU|nr:LysE family translocator [Umezawaea tangerina]PRY39470.1 threonine/homoserine/homoserine lactone efflux protein [Umezawaea tangerina]